MQTPWHTSQLHSTTAGSASMCFQRAHVLVPGLHGRPPCRTQTHHAAGGVLNGAGCQWPLVHRIMGASCMHGPCCVFCLQRQAAYSKLSQLHAAVTCIPPPSPPTWPASTRCSSWLATPHRAAPSPPTWRWRMCCTMLHHATRS
jgi:hypothetical protein